MAPRLALLKAALCLGALHAHCATADATENCVVCGGDEATCCPCKGCDGSVIVQGMVTVDCSYAGIVSLAPQPLNDTLPEGTERLCVEWLDSASASACLRLRMPPRRPHTPPPPPTRPAPRLSSASAAATLLEARADRRAPPRALTSCAGTCPTTSWRRCPSASSRASRL